jgi:hypothetical protein
MTGLKKSREEQRNSLRMLVNYATNPIEGQCNFGAMVLFDHPSDVAFLAPAAPELRGVEIVSALGKGDYDIWKKSRLLKSGLGAAEVVQWLNSQCQHTEADYMQHLRQWTTELLEYYNVPKR